MKSKENIKPASLPAEGPEDGMEKHAKCANCGKPGDKWSTMSTWTHAHDGAWNCHPHSKEGFVPAEGVALPNVDRYTTELFRTDLAALISSDDKKDQFGWMGVAMMRLNHICDERSAALSESAALRKQLEEANARINSLREVMEVAYGQIDQGAAIRARRTLANTLDNWKETV